MLVKLITADKTTVSYSTNSIINQSTTDVCLFDYNQVTNICYLGKPALPNKRTGKGGQNLNSFQSYFKAVMPLCKTGGKLPSKPIVRLVSSNIIKVSSKSDLNNLIQRHSEKIASGITNTDRKLKYKLSVNNALEAIQCSELLDIIKQSGLLPLRNFKGVSITKKDLIIFFGLSIFNPKGIVTKVTASLKAVNDAKVIDLNIEELKNKFKSSSINEPLF